MTEQRVVGLVGCAAGGVELIRQELVEPLIDDGFRVAVTLTPTAARWLTETGELAKLEDITGYPVRSRPRLPGEKSPHPHVAAYAVIPATANTVAKLALGVSDNQALTQLCEGLGLGVPIAIFPRINAAHARHPAWANHLAALGNAGVHLIYGDDIWPLHEPRSAPSRTLPWAALRSAVRRAAVDSARL